MPKPSCISGTGCCSCRQRSVPSRSQPGAQERVCTNRPRPQRGPRTPGGTVPAPPAPRQPRSRPLARGASSPAALRGECRGRAPVPAGRLPRRRERQARERHRQERHKQGRRSSGTTAGRPRRAAPRAPGAAGRGARSRRPHRTAPRPAQPGPAQPGAAGPSWRDCDFARVSSSTGGSTGGAQSPAGMRWGFSVRKSPSRGPAARYLSCFCSSLSFLACGSSAAIFALAGVWRASLASARPPAPARPADRAGTANGGRGRRGGRLCRAPDG